MTKLYYYYRLCKLNEVSPEDRDSNSLRRKVSRNRMRHSRTIVDPCYPVFRYDGLPVSQSLYEQYVASHCEELRDNSDGLNERRGDDGNLQSRSLPSDLISAKLPINSSRNSITKNAHEGMLFIRYLNRILKILKNVNLLI